MDDERELTGAGTGDGEFGGVHEMLATHVSDRGVGGLAWAVSFGDRVESGAAGWLDPDRRERPVPVDGVFRIASVSKPMVAVAALQLVAEGLVGLDEPVDEVLPELADREVLVEADGPLDQATVAADRPLSLRDLLTFRCGLGVDFGVDGPQPLVERLWELGIGPGPTAPDLPPDEYLGLLGALPLADQPGTRWRYHTGSDIVSVFVERVRGATLDVVMERDLFEPLAMTDTGFWVRPEQKARFGACRMEGETGGPGGPGDLVVWDKPSGRWSAPPRFRSGATGLVSTTADLVAFGRMLLRGGVGPRGPVLSGDLVAEMTSDQLTDQQRRAARIDESDALGWGLGVGVVSSTSGWPPAGAYRWDGGLGSRWLVDPTSDLCAVLLCTDGFVGGVLPAVMDDFVEAIAAALPEGS